MAGRLFYGDADVEMQEHETVLDALLRSGVDVPYSCKSGACQSCLVRCDGAVPPRATQGLKETLAAQGYALSCQCRGSDLGGSDIRVLPIDTDTLFQEAMLLRRIALAPSISRLVFELDEPMAFEPGQFVHLKREDGLVRSYSIASGPDAPNEIEIHVGRVERGQMSNYLLDELSCGDRVALRGPSGNCFYVPGRADQPLLLVGTGTGLAPLLGVLRSALSHGHRGPIHLYHGSVHQDGTYLRNELQALAATHELFHYHAFADAGDPEELLKLGLQTGRASAAALAAHRNLKGWRVFLCGHPAMVQTTRKLAYLGGASISDIFADPFEIAAAPVGC